MAVKVTLIEVDGYDDWAPKEVTQIELEEFTPTYLALHITNGDCADAEEIGDCVVENQNVISIMAECNGFHAVLIG